MFVGFHVYGKDKYFIVNIKKTDANFACYCKGTMVYGILM